MKKLIFLLLLVPTFAFAQLPQSDRWTLLYENSKTNQKTYIDTQTITALDYLDGHSKVYLFWLRTYTDLSSTHYNERMDVHMAFDLSRSQFEMKSLSKFKDDGTVIVNQQIEISSWIDILPESHGEIILNYLRKLNK